MALTRTRTDWTELGWPLCLTAPFLMALGLSGCNTARGVGEDVSVAGNPITEPLEDDDEDASPGA